MYWHLCIFSPVEFRYNQVQSTRLEDSSLPGETLISCFRCVFIGVEAKLWRTRSSRTECGCPALSLPLSLNPYLHASGFSQACAKSEVQCFTWNLGTYKTATGNAVVCFSRPASGAWGPSVCSYQQITSLHFHLMTAYQISPFAFSASYDRQSPWLFSILKLSYDSQSDLAICILWQPITVALFYLEPGLQEH